MNVQISQQIHSTTRLQSVHDKGKFFNRFSQQDWNDGNRV